MQCPFCGARDTKVLDSRPAEHRIRRRRECIFCGKRFTTYEMVERPLLMVKKRERLLKALNSSVQMRCGAQ